MTEVRISEEEMRAAIRTAIDGGTTGQLGAWLLDTIAAVAAKGAMNLLIAKVRSADHKAR